MSDTYTHLLFHLIFGTKHRAPLITVEIREDLYRYLTGIVSKIGGTLIAVGGMPDHVHLLVGLRPTHSVSEMMRDLKGSSSRWLNDMPGIAFAWQNGYGAFSVSGSNLATVARYILHQEEHHRRFSFQDELREFLEKHGLKADPRSLDTLLD
jgi:REP element-mobilizing transposase RayT